MFCLNFGSPRVLEQITSTQLERTLVLLKERKKRMRRNGSFLQHYSDRDMFYNLMGGPKGAIFIVERVPDRKNYIHHHSRAQQYHIRVVKKRNNAYDQMGHIMRHNQMWDGSHNSTNPLYDGALRVNWRGVTKDNAVAMFERWGVKGMVMDEIMKPNQGDMKYFKHRLYMYNFPWIRDPVTTRDKGDADWSWKGEDKMDYSTYGAKTADSRNDFMSLWRDAVAKHGNGVAASNPVFAEAAKPATSKSATTNVAAPKEEAKATPVAEKPKEAKKDAAAEEEKKEKKSAKKTTEKSAEKDKDAGKKA
eukprot:GILI01009574.1.p1 GENE.GILI01009574.1~~GILI01009574.1.p1  ORF type:complete len:305 (-),score=68.99 GILI01009574.1:164-1078(-)